MKQARADLSRFIGVSPESLSLKDRLILAGKFAAFEIYTPKTTPLRRMEAIADSTEDCVRALLSRGLDPLRFEFVQLPAPY